MENEQHTLEKMLTNTQQSNSEMLDANRLVKDELRESNTRVIRLQQELEEEEKQKIVTENKLLSLEKVRVFVMLNFYIQLFGNPTNLKHNYNKIL